MIVVRDIRKRFGSVEAVRGISFPALDGQITGLLGANGAGKTTTLAMICGLIRPDGGSIQVDGDNGTEIGRRRQIGSLLDHKGLYERLTARENITYFGKLHDIDAADLDARVDEVIALLGLDRVADRRTAGFSQGERMKVALARAIVHAPPHVLLDEPTNGLDIPSVAALRDVLREMRRRGACIIFSSHVLDDVRALCDTVVVMSRGTIVATGTVTDICRQARCSSLEDAVLKLTREAVASVESVES